MELDFTTFPDPANAVTILTNDTESFLPHSLFVFFGTLVFRFFNVFAFYLNNLH